MFEKTKYFLCTLFIALCIGVTSNLYAQIEPRLLGAAGLVLDSRTQPYRAITIDVPTTLTLSYPLHLPVVPPPGPFSILGSDVNGAMSWISGTGLLPGLPPNNIWVGNSLGVAVPYAPTVPGAVLILSPSSTPTWSNVIPLNTTISVSQLTTGTLQSGVTINVGPGSTINPAGGTVTSNNIIGAGPGNFAGTIVIPQNSLTLSIPYTPIQSGAAIQISIIDPSLPGVAVYVTQITPGTGFTVSFSASYPTTTGKVFYTIINP